MISVTLNWVGGEHKFALPLGRLRALQKNVDAGPEQLLQRMARGDWRVDDVIETLRQGLIGGGMSESQAGPLVMLMADQNPLEMLKRPAYAVLAAALVGVEDDPVGEPEGATSPQESGSSASIMASAE